MMYHPLGMTIDGPAASGKSTVARAIAGLLGWPCIDTGILYRAVAWSLYQEQIDPHNGENCATRVPTILPLLILSQDSAQAFIQGQDITKQLQTSSLLAYAPIVASHPQVRKLVVEHLRERATECSVVMVGRDCGTVVLPEAMLKIFLTASLQIRAERRYQEVKDRQLGEPVPPIQREEVLAELQRRDGQDQHQLSPAPGAHVIETDSLGLPQVCDSILALLRGKGILD